MFLLFTDMQAYKMQRVVSVVRHLDDMVEENVIKSVV